MLDNGAQRRTDAQGYLATYLNYVQQRTTNILNMPADLNNLLPPIESTRCLLWRESAPTR